MIGKIADRKVSLAHQGQKVRLNADGQEMALTVVYVPGEGARLVNRESKNRQPDMELDQEIWQAIMPLRGAQVDGCTMALTL